jgi:hypothetical protein
MRHAGGYRDGEPVGSIPFEADALAESRRCAANVPQRQENPTERQV